MSSRPHAAPPAHSVVLSLDALRAGVDHFFRHPGELLHTLRNAAKLRIAVPLDALRWIFARIPAEHARDLVIQPQPPALGVTGVVTVMGYDLRVSARVRLDEASLSPSELRLALRLSDATVQAADDAGPLAAAIRKASLDLSKPGSLLDFLPKRPPILVEARDDRVVVDLMRARSIASHAGTRRALAVLSPVVEITGAAIEDDFLVVTWRPHAKGLPAALRALRHQPPRPGVN